MTDTTLFGGEQPAGQPPVGEPTPLKVEPNQLLTKLMEIKNENGQPKYDTLEKALDALAHAQQFIPKVKTEKDELAAKVAELEAKLAASGNVEDIVSKLLQKKEEPLAPKNNQ